MVLKTVPALVGFHVLHGVEILLDLSMEGGARFALYGQTAMIKSQPASALLLLIFLILLQQPLNAGRLPDPTFKTLDGMNRKLSALHGQIVVVNFWASWCGPCQEELPRLSRIAAQYEGKPVRFILISIDDPKDRRKIPEMLAKLHVSLESWVGADTDTLGRFGLGNIVPGTVVLDEDGESITRVMGEAKEDDVRNAIDWLLDGRKSQAPPSMIKRY